MPSFERSILDALPLTVYAVDLEGRITSANRSASRTAGDSGTPESTADASLLGRPIWDALDDDAARDPVERAMAQLRAGRASVVRWEHPSGPPEDGHVSLVQVTPLVVGHAVGGYVFCTVDITPSHRARAALVEAGLALARTASLDHAFRELALQLRLALRGEGLAVALADEGAVIPRLVHLDGYTEEGPAIEQRLTPVWREAIAGGRVIHHPTPAGVELTAPLTGANGVLGAVTLLAEPIESAERLEEGRHVLATLAAHTAAAIARARLAHRVERRRRLEAVGEVATGVAHELRNPLFGISSAAQLLRFRAREDPVVERNVGRILREVERLNRMVTALLDYGRPAATELRAGDPDAVWDTVWDAHQGLLESRALCLRRTRATPPARCALDAHQLAQAFANVLVNAVDAAPEATDLTLVSVTLPGGGWRCRLTNGGPPIPPELLARAFEIFFSTKPGGAGIGLPLSQRIVEEHHGSIALESAPDEGTTVTITLPGA
ncbi:MAG TPA: ATP-binding protein [Gemmatimonadaceae bacterium]|nr:ATP-binding protein [Gemmatimonadaceae bacterium]